MKINLKWKKRDPEQIKQRPVPLRILQTFLFTLFVEGFVFVMIYPVNSLFGDYLLFLWVVLTQGALMYFSIFKLPRDISYNLTESLTMAVVLIIFCGTGFTMFEKFGNHNSRIAGAILAFFLMQAISIFYLVLYNLSVIVPKISSYLKERKKTRKKAKPAAPASLSGSAS